MPIETAVGILVEKEEDFDTTEIEAKINSCLMKSVEYQGLADEGARKRSSKKARENTPEIKVKQAQG